MSARQAMPPANRFASRLPALAAVFAVAFAPVTALAQAGPGFGGLISYTGALGPINGQRPLCLCVYRDADLRSQLGCAIYSTNPLNYALGLPTAGNYYVVAFVDFHLNERLDADEPYEIYRDRAAPPADPVFAGSERAGIDFVFGDQNLPGAPTPSATVPPEPTATVTLEPTATVPPEATTALRCDGDCDGNKSVTVAEIVLAVGIALGIQAPAICPPADADGNGQVSIAEIVRAVNAGLGGCSG